MFAFEDGCDIRVDVHVSDAGPGPSTIPGTCYLMTIPADIRAFYSTATLIPSMYISKGEWDLNNDGIIQDDEKLAGWKPLPKIQQ